ncbi:hypothetical protein [Peptostreptococcus stomatis]|uniref:hypothetical protein n=1 Tax=Peptostreptococcus stomatis TaxID=341694 RepID=UPI003F9FAD4D
MILVEGQMVHIETTYGSIIEGEIFNIYNFINDGKKQTTIIIKSKERLTKVNLASIVEFHVLDSKKSITIARDKFISLTDNIIREISKLEDKDAERNKDSSLIRLLKEYTNVILIELFGCEADDD